MNTVTFEVPMFLLICIGLFLLGVGFGRLKDFDNEED